MTHNKTGVYAVIAIATLCSMMLIGFVPSARGQDELPTSILAPIGSSEVREVSTPSGPVHVVDIPNWAGYAVTGSSFTNVLGGWVVPPYHCLKTPNSESVFFVGFDGYPSTNRTLEAVGTASDCSPGTSPLYFAWYTLGGTIVEVPSFSVKTGDLISASVSYSGSDFTVAISNITQGLFFSKSAKVSGAKRSSAEWVVARENTLPPLMDFGKISSGFDYTSITDSDWATDSSVSGPISDFGSKVVKINMIHSGVLYATPSALTTDGSSFSVTWKY